jgi:anhydro-N-acetylmuramic acid kinase
MPDQDTHRGTSVSVIGVMSGTSLDGLDIALCEFTHDPSFSFRIIKATTYEYSAIWKQRLSGIKDASAEKYFTLNALFGKYIGERINEFVGTGMANARAIASHGHTVFHQPHAGFSTQIGCGATIAATTGLTTIADFRSLDVASGGQGAPLVPAGDKLLFGKYAACLNLGGIANISFEKNGQRVAYDICEANMLLNYLSELSGQSYDAGGEAARSGKVHENVLDKLQALEYYTQKGAKSMGREWFEKQVLPIIRDSSAQVNDLLATATEHIARVISNEINANKIKDVLVTGGGAFNEFLIEKLRSKTSSEIILPVNDIINFKEALIFAFLGYLRLLEKPNALGSVTGAPADTIGGAVYLMRKK